MNEFQILYYMIFVVIIIFTIYYFWTDLNNLYNTGGDFAEGFSIAKNLGNDPQNTLDLCQGDCDNDDSCKGDMVCWQQNYQLFPKETPAYQNSCMERYIMTAHRS